MSSQSDPTQSRFAIFGSYDPVTEVLRLTDEPYRGPAALAARKGPPDEFYIGKIAFPLADLDREQAEKLRRYAVQQLRAWPELIARYGTSPWVEAVTMLNGRVVLLHDDIENYASRHVQSLHGHFQNGTIRVKGQRETSDQVTLASNDAFQIGDLAALGSLDRNSLKNTVLEKYLTANNNSSPAVVSEISFDGKARPIELEEFQAARRRVRQQLAFSIVDAYAAANRIPVEYLRDLQKAGLVRGVETPAGELVVFTHRRTEPNGLVTKAESSYAPVLPNGPHERVGAAIGEASLFRFQTSPQVDQVILTTTTAEALQCLSVMERNTRSIENTAFFSLNGNGQWPARELVQLAETGVALEIMVNLDRNNGRLPSELTNLQVQLQELNLPITGFSQAGSGFVEHFHSLPPETPASSLPHLGEPCSLQQLETGPEVEFGM